jgi:hypothetical protein
MINNRLTALEQRLKPAQNTREPLLVELISADKPSTGILYVYHGEHKGEYRLDTKQFSDYQKRGILPVPSIDSKDARRISDIKPRPTTVQLDSVYDKEPSFRYKDD